MVRLSGLYEGGGSECVKLEAINFVDLIKYFLINIKLVRFGQFNGRLSVSSGER